MDSSIVLVPHFASMTRAGNCGTPITVVPKFLVYIVGFEIELYSGDSGRR